MGKKDKNPADSSPSVPALFWSNEAAFAAAARALASMYREAATAIIARTHALRIALAHAGASVGHLPLPVPQRDLGPEVAFFFLRWQPRVLAFVVGLRNGMAD